MISLARVSAKMGRTYYTQDSYYTKDVAIEHSEWFGYGAKRDGLYGHVDTKIFQNLLDEHSKSKRAAFDLTFSAPKSVSLACLVNGDNQLLEAHKKAVNTALNVVQERFSYARVGSKKNRQIEISGNILAAQFLHDVSRSKDPQLHTHCVVFNKVQCADGRSRALHNDGIFNHSKLIGLVYQNELAHEVKKLGYEINLNTNGTFEIEGYTKNQLDAFSKRTKQIEALECPTKKQERIEKLIDRPARGKSVPRELLQERWVAECNAVHILHPEPKSFITFSNQLHNQIPNTNIKDAIDHVTEKDVRFKKEDIEKYTLHHNMGAVPFQSYQKEFSNLKFNQTLIEYEKDMFTTKQALLVEERMLKSIEYGQNKFDPIENNAVQKITAQHPTLTKGQENALITSLMTKDQFIAWQGVAGAGKTYALNIFHSIAIENGCTIKGFAQSAEAAQVLSNEAKILSQTVASLLTAKDKSEFTSDKSKEIWIVDEAGLLGAIDCANLIERAQIQNARVIFVGDTKQMPAISAGNPFQLMQEHGIQTVHLQQSLRQKKLNLKQAVDCVANNQIQDGLKHIRENIHEIKDFNQKIQWIRDEYLKSSPIERDKTLILTACNDERSKITKEVRNHLLQSKDLTDTVTIRQLSPKYQTSAESRSILNYQKNDVLIFYQEHAQYGIKKNTPYFIQSIDQKNTTLKLCDQNTSLCQTVSISPRIGGFTTYTEKTIEIAKGDKVKWTKNDGYLGIRNGQDFVVENTNNDAITLKSSQGKLISLMTQNPMHIDYNYVHTVYSSQGKTCDKVIISENKNFGKEMLYVALSRAKHDVHIVSQNKEQFLNSNQISNQKLSAKNLIKEVKCPISVTHTKSITRKRL
jgi:conjugative relaxase-like TrwC/TraI family protein